MKDELGGQVIKNFVGLRAKTYSYLKDNLKFRDYKKCLKASQIENIINYLEKKQIDADSLKKIIKYKMFVEM